METKEYVRGVSWLITWWLIEILDKKLSPEHFKRRVIETINAYLSGIERNGSLDQQNNMDAKVEFLRGVSGVLDERMKECDIEILKPFKMRTRREFYSVLAFIHGRLAEILRDKEKLYYKR